MKHLTIVLLLLTSNQMAIADEPEKTLDLHTGLMSYGVPFQGGNHRFCYGISLTAQLNKKR